MGHRGLRAIARARSRATCCKLSGCFSSILSLLVKYCLPALPNHVLAVADEASPKTSRWVRLSFIFVSIDEKLTRRKKRISGRVCARKDYIEWQARENLMLWLNDDRAQAGGTSALSGLFCLLHHLLALITTWNLKGRFCSALMHRSTDGETQEGDAMPSWATMPLQRLCLAASRICKVLHLPTRVVEASRVCDVIADQYSDGIIPSSVQPM